MMRYRMPRFPSVLRKGPVCLLGAFLASCSSPHSGTGPDHSSRFPFARKTFAPRIGLVVPLTGPHAAVGRQLRDAVLLGTGRDARRVPVDIIDGAQSPEAVAGELEENHNTFVIGPLGAAETGKLAQTLSAAPLPGLAFTSDGSLGKPGLWVMGLTPDQQAEALVQFAAGRGKRDIAAFLPDTAFGRELGRGLMEAAEAENIPSPKVVYHSADPQEIRDQLAALSAISQRRQNSGSVPGEKVAASVAENLQPPPFNALLLADTGETLGSLIRELPQDGITSGNVQILGPALWKGFDSKLGALAGAVYVGESAAGERIFADEYERVYHRKPASFAGMGFDAGAIAGRVLSEPSRGISALFNPYGFQGVQGWVRFMPDGSVARKLEFFQILPSGGVMLTSAAPDKSTDDQEASGFNRPDTILSPSAGESTASLPDFQ